MTGEEVRDVSRRDFIRKSTAAVVGAGALLSGVDSLLFAETEAVKPREKVKTATKLPTRKLGRTNLLVTTISFGGIYIRDPRLLDAAIDKGINLVHTSPGYVRGRGIGMFGQVMKTKRDKVFLALKQRPDTEALDRDLKTLNTDYADILVPPLHTVEALRDPGLPGAYEKAKKAGKIRFSGFACHKNEAEVIKAAIELGYFDVMLINYNVRNRAELDPILAEAKKRQNMGFMVMKAMRGLPKDNAELAAAGLKKLLSNKNVDTLVMGMGSFENLETDLKVASEKITVAEELMLREHLAAALPACTMCGKCDVCPRGIPVADIMRYKQVYYDERGDVELAQTSYREIPKLLQASACDNCGLCERACPAQLAVRAELAAAHALLA